MASYSCTAPRDSETEHRSLREKITKECLMQRSRQCGRQCSSFFLPATTRPRSRHSSRGTSEQPSLESAATSSILASTSGRTEPFSGKRLLSLFGLLLSPFFQSRKKTPALWVLSSEGGRRPTNNFLNKIRLKSPSSPLKDPILTELRWPTQGLAKKVQRTPVQMAYFVVVLTRESARGRTERVLYNRRP